MRTRHATALVVAALLIAACSVRPSAVPTRAATGVAGCSVTHPASLQSIPQEVIDIIGGGASVPIRQDQMGTLFGNDALWVTLPQNGKGQSERPGSSHGCGS